MVGGVVGQASEKAEGQDVCRIVVIGSGIAGLAAAFYLKQGLGNRSNVELLVLERFGKAGGTISTYHVDDFILELGPDSF